MAAAPAMACGYSSCGSPCGYSYNPCAQAQYVAPVAAYSYSYGYGYGSGCGGCGGYATARLAEPTSQYYYVNQGPTYSGPGAWAPQPRYYEPAVSGWSNYSRPYEYGYVARPRYYGPRTYHYGYRAPRPYAYGYGYAPRHMHAMHRHMHAAPYGYGRPLRRYY